MREEPSRVESRPCVLDPGQAGGGCGGHPDAGAEAAVAGGPARQERHNGAHIAQDTGPETYVPREGGGRRLGMLGRDRRHRRSSRGGDDKAWWSQSIGTGPGTADTPPRCRAHEARGAAPGSDSWAGGILASNSRQRLGAPHTHEADAARAPDTRADDSGHAQRATRSAVRQSASDGDGRCRAAVDGDGRGAARPAARRAGRALGLDSAHGPRPQGQLAELLLHPRCRQVPPRGRRRGHRQNRKGHRGRPRPHGCPAPHDRGQGLVGAYDAVRLGIRHDAGAAATGLRHAQAEVLGLVVRLPMIGCSPPSGALPASHFPGAAHLSCEAHRAVRPSVHLLAFLAFALRIEPDHA